MRHLAAEKRHCLRTNWATTSSSGPLLRPSRHPTSSGGKKTFSNSFHSVIIKIGEFVFSAQALCWACNEINICLGPMRNCWIIKVFHLWGRNLVDNSTSTCSKPYQSEMKLSAGARMIQSWLDARNYWHQLPSLSLKATGTQEAMRATGIRATTRATDPGTGVKAQLHVHQLSTIGHT